MEAMPSHVTKIKTPAMLQVERRAKREAEAAIKVSGVEFAKPGGSDLKCLSS